MKPATPALRRKRRPSSPLPERTQKMIELANARIESILRKLRGEKPVRPTEGCSVEPPTFGAMRQLTESQQRQLNRLLNSIEELDSLI